MSDDLLPYPSLYAAFRAAAARAPDHVVVRDGEDTSYAELEQQSRAAARALIALGLGADDKVGIWAVNHLRWIVAGLGVQASGATLIPAGTRLKPREIGDILRRTRTRVILLDPSFGSSDFVTGILNEDLPDLTHVVVFDDRPPEGRAMGWKHFIALGDAVSEIDLDARIASIGPDAIADILFTSGTTGMPKGVPMTHGQSMIACEQQQRFISHFSEADVFAIPFPFAHNAGYRAGWQMCLLYGARLIPLRTYDPLDMMRLIERERVTVLAAGPTIYQQILDHPERPAFDMSGLRIAITGGTTTPVKLIEEMQQAFGHEAVMTSYGMTETAGSVTTTAPSDRPEVVATTVGKAYPDVAIRLLDADHREVGRGEPGEIAVRGLQVLRGYYEDDAATASAFTEDGFFLTGDVGIFDDEGNLRITDRLKDMYIVGGFNTYPAEIEQQLCRLEGVAEVAVIGVDDSRLGQVGRAFIVRRPDSPLDEASVKAWCRETMANYKVPRAVTFVASLPRNNQGKIAKNDLRAWPGLEAGS